MTVEDCNEEVLEVGDFIEIVEPGKSPVYTDLIGKTLQIRAFSSDEDNNYISTVVEVSSNEEYHLGMLSYRAKSLKLSYVSHISPEDLPF